MPTISRERAVGSGPEAVWEVVADPEHLPRWWPNVTRVEEAHGGAWTAVLGSGGARAVRADYTLLASERPRRLEWEHEVEESPFARLLAESITEVELEPAAGGSTLVRLTARLKLRGFSRLGFLQVGRAWRRQLDGALDGLTLLFGDGVSG